MKRSFLFTMLIGAVIAALIITGASFWMSAGARRATDRAAEKISDFYLEELAGRRSQVVSRFFDTKADQMRRAMALMTEEDLSSQDALRSFIGKVEALYGLDLFAVADEDNVVYTDHTTYMGGSRYAFLSAEREYDRMITTSSAYGGGKEICMAVSVNGLRFMGKSLKTCFVEINMDDIVSVLAFNAEENGTHFSLYYQNGENLTGLDFGPIGAKQNLIQEMSRYLSAEGVQALSDNFMNGAAGEAHFASSGSGQILYYSPIPETGWMITVLIHKNLIYDQIGGIREETMTRSVVQIFVTCASLLIFFSWVVMKQRRESKALLEQERKIAVRDAMTGVGNKYAFSQKESEVNAAIQKGAQGQFGIVILDLNGLKQVNDTLGHLAGDNYIREASRIICELYRHSPVYRIGGDEFAVYLQDTDYERRQDIMNELDQLVAANKKSGGVVIAAGMAEYQSGDHQVHDVFERADQRMYERKKRLKEE